LPTCGDEPEDDVIPRGQVGYSRAHLLHRSRPFVPTNDGQRNGEITRDQVLIGMAHARCRQPDEHLASPWRVKLNGLDAPIRVCFPQNGRFSLHDVLRRGLVVPL